MDLNVHTRPRSWCHHKRTQEEVGQSQAGALPQANKASHQGLAARWLPPHFHPHPPQSPTGISLVATLLGNREGILGNAAEPNQGVA